MVLKKDLPIKGAWRVFQPSLLSSSNSEASAEALVEAQAEAQREEGSQSSLIDGEWHQSHPSHLLHSENKKYFQEPFLVLQLVTKRGFVSVPGRISYPEGT